MDNISLETVSTLVGIVAVLMIFVTQIVMRRLGRMAELIEDLQKQNKILQGHIAELQKKPAPAVSVPVEDKTAEQGAVPAADKKKPPSLSAAAEVMPPMQMAAQTGPGSAIVAAITAAMAVYGYPPESIRSIRPAARVHNKGWVMAGRLYNINRNM